MFWLRQHPATSEPRNKERENIRMLVMTSGVIWNCGWRALQRIMMFCRICIMISPTRWGRAANQCSDLSSEHGSDLKSKRSLGLGGITAIESIAHSLWFSGINNGYAEKGLTMPWQVLGFDEQDVDHCVVSRRGIHGEGCYSFSIAQQRHCATKIFEITISAIQTPWSLRLHGFCYARTLGNNRW